MSSARSRAARKMMAETGWTYTRALREVLRRRAEQEESDMGRHDKIPAAATAAGPVSTRAPAPGGVAETRGGEHPDWANARPGEPLLRLPEENDDPDAP